MTTAATSKLNFRVKTESETKLRAAAAALGMSLTDFVIGTAVVRADEVLVSHTVADADFFDNLVQALDRPWQPPTRGRLSQDARHAEKVVRQA